MLSSSPIDVDPNVLAPFPDLPNSVLPSNEHCPKSPKKRCHHDLVNQTKSRSKVKGRSSQPVMATTKAATTSAPISLPKSHVERTHSELRLEMLTLRAEGENMRMYSRLRSGIQEQMRYRNVATGGDNAHPLSRMSLRLQNVEQQKRTPSDKSATDAGWDLSYVPIDGPLKSPQIGEELRDLPLKPATEIKTSGQEEDCVFSLEM